MNRANADTLEGEHANAIHAWTEALSVVETTLGGAHLRAAAIRAGRAEALAATGEVAGAKRDLDAAEAISWSDLSRT